MWQIRVEQRIARPPDVVRRWWLEFPEVYENPREQPHRIVTRSRDATHIDTLTYWRTPFGEVEIPERFTLHETGWDVDVDLRPFGLKQRDHFSLADDAEGGTLVVIHVGILPATWRGRLLRPLYLAYARRSYPRTWRAAARWCEEATALPPKA